MIMGKPAPLVIHGWTIFAHPLFLAQIEALAQQVETLKQKDRFGYVKKNASKRLAAITKLAFDVVPQDPARPEYRQGGTLGDDQKHWPQPITHPFTPIPGARRSVMRRMVTTFTAQCAAIGLRVRRLQSIISA